MFEREILGDGARPGHGREQETSIARLHNNTIYIVSNVIIKDRGLQVGWQPCSRTVPRMCLILLIIGEVRHSRFVRVQILKETIAPEEIVREGTLRTYWLVMNSFVLLLLVVGFSIASKATPCPVSAPDGSVPYFLYAFGAIALARDYLDFRYAWRFLYPVRSDRAASLDKWPITAIAKGGSLLPWALLGYAMVAATIIAVTCLKFWNVSHWVAACAMGHA